MAKIFLSQTALTINVDTKIDLSSAVTVILKIKKPKVDDIDEWDCDIDDKSNGLISHDIEKGDLNVVGLYKGWVYVTFVNGTIASGEVFTFQVYNEGN